MKLFNEIISEVQTEKLNEFLKPGEFEELNENQKQELENLLYLYESRKNEEDIIDEGLITKLLGGTAGFIIGPFIGKIIANALGIEKGIVYDMLTSRLANAALGAALTKYLSDGK